VQKNRRDRDAQERKGADRGERGRKVYCAEKSASSKERDRLKPICGTECGARGKLRKAACNQRWMQDEDQLDKHEKNRLFFRFNI
jgi:hypothetical protein